LTERLNALANSDDTTLDQMAEVVAYIKDNRGLIESITTTKVNVADFLPAIIFTPIIYYVSNFIINIF
jgi:oligoribonuclease (3'-5' exoribonuclease)